VTSFDVSVRVLDLLTEEQARDVRNGVARTTAADGVGPLSEDARLRLEPGERGAVHLVVGAPGGGGLAGYAQLERGSDPSDEATAELFVQPELRGRGIGTALLREVRAQAPDLFVWSHGDLPAAQRLAQREGLVRVRDLWQMRRPLEELPEVPPTPDDVQLRTFQPGRDEDAWLELNATAFAHHPEQGGWTRHDLELREREEWFDPSGFFLAERDGRLVGFHWTKVHPEGLGEVYVLGVAPDEAGHGLGSWLTAVGLHHLRDRGLPTVLLYVEADNAPAVTVYQRSGFTRHTVDVGYHSP
jgi:mycothiol synthase